MTGYKEPTWYDPYTKPLIKPFNDFTFSYGKTMVAAAEELSNRAVAYPDPDALPSLAGAPTLTKPQNTNKVCNGTATSSEECIRCRSHGDAPPAPADTFRPECFTLKVCVRPDSNGDGFADCDPAINEQWIWQMVAVIHPAGP